MMTLRSEASNSSDPREMPNNALLRKENPGLEEEREILKYAGWENATAFFANQR